MAELLILCFLRETGISEEASNRAGCLLAVILLGLLIMALLGII